MASDSDVPVDLSVSAAEALVAIHTREALPCDPVAVVGTPAQRLENKHLKRAG
jgi:hypothetical protein